MEIQGFGYRFWRRSQEVEDIPGEDQARSRRLVQRQDIFVSTLSAGKRKLSPVSDKTT